MSRAFKFVTNIAIGVLAFLFILFTGIGIFELAQSMREYTISEDTMLYALQSGQYSDLTEYYHHNQAVDAKSTKTMEECYAIARYYEAAIDYKLAIQENNMELQKEAEEKMELASKEMGELSYAGDEIDALLEI